MDNLQFFTSKQGMKIPVIGIGTWQSDKGKVCEAVKAAITIGYRHIDCAFVYGNEAEVGEGIASKISDGTVKRESLFVTSKLWSTFHRPDLVRGACEESLKLLNLDYLDLYLIHWPMGMKEDGPLFPIDDNNQPLHSNVDYLDTWKAMEQLVDAGLCKAIGLSNFNSSQISRLLQNCRIPPANLQIESSPYMLNQQLTDFAHSHGITVTAYSPLGCPARSWAKPDDPILLEEPLLKSLGEKYKKSPAQILIRFQLDRGVAVIPKSVTPTRIRENFDVFDFSLNKDELSSIGQLDKSTRIAVRSNMRSHKFYPFDEPY